MAKGSRENVSTSKQRFIMREDAKTFIDDIGKIDFGWNNLPDTLNNNK